MSIAVCQRNKYKNAEFATSRDLCCILYTLVMSC
uniref:Uncharacterized protein n=1 Tax=Geladintestivirus 6 TaxID=3233138 RepID=A0AAU8MJM2_9CAUD